MKGGTKHTGWKLVAVQLMVNMTTANALMNLFHTLVTLPASPADRERLIEDCLHIQAPLMRNPRLAKNDVEVDGGIRL